ncbi:hypothetical protein [Ascidiimonas aurantiaca]|uniref:hypothetical protein n=1 Tax=Ascidiimonas aurantiaca TaxID=1685432 RepID=UPI0030EC0680
MKKEVLKNQLFYFNRINILLFFLLLSLSSSIYGQELDCSNFRDGVFYAEISKPVIMKWKVTRKRYQQVEEVVELPEVAKEINFSTNSLHEIIEWIDDCTYRLKYDETKMELSDTQKIINENGGVLTRIVRIEGKCHYYVSTLSINGEESSMEGKLCTR